MQNAAIIYQGPSMLDGSPIVAVATGLSGKSRNSKTGALIQTWILRADMSPIDAVNSGADAAICGSCVHRGVVTDGRNSSRSCYVTVFQAPMAIYRTFVAGRYETATGDALRELGANKRIRLGAYGDPAAVPMHIWHTLMSDAEAGTGYTHAWRTSSDLQAYCMASVDTVAEYDAAKAAGWRTFRVRRSTDPLEVREIACPASHEAGQKTSCASCVACGGHSSKARVDVTIMAHGAASKVNAFNGRLVVDDTCGLIATRNH